MTYMQRLGMLNLESLEVQRLFHDLVFMHKLVFGHARIAVPVMFKSNQVNTRGHRFKINVQYSMLNIRKLFFFVNRTV